MFQGTEGWHVDGNTVELPHTFTIIHCISANKNGPTLLVPLREIVQSLSEEERLDDNTLKTTFNDILKLIVFTSAEHFIPTISLTWCEEEPVPVLIKMSIYN